MKITYPIFIMAFFLSLMSPALCGQRKAIDARNASEATTIKHYLVFSANSGNPGHAFVAWASEDNNKQMSSSVAFGLYPNKSNVRTALSFILGPVPGKIVNEASKGNFGQQSQNLVVRVTKAQFEAANRIRMKWAAKKDYTLIHHDCVAFISEVARSIQVKVPPRNGALKPASFVVKMIVLN